MDACFEFWTPAGPYAPPNTTYNQVVNGGVAQERTQHTSELDWVPYPSPVSAGYPSPYNDINGHFGTPSEVLDAPNSSANQPPCTEVHSSLAIDHHPGLISPGDSPMLYTGPNIAMQRTLALQDMPNHISREQDSFAFAQQQTPNTPTAVQASLPYPPYFSPAAFGNWTKSFQNYPALHGFYNQISPPPDSFSTLPRSASGIRTSMNTSVESAPRGHCYALLLWHCLASQPGHVMSLAGIYAWFKQHTDKAKNPDADGWKNSIRHNLSLNEAFEIEIGDGQNLWHLADYAYVNGVASTTTFRKSVADKRSDGGTQTNSKRKKLASKNNSGSARVSNQSKAIAAPTSSPGLTAWEYRPREQELDGMSTPTSMFSADTSFFAPSTPSAYSDEPISSTYNHPADSSCIDPLLLLLPSRHYG